MQRSEALVRPEGEAERRHLTVMFCDLANSTALSRRLDAEELREVLHTYQEACEVAIRSFDGWVAQYLGDGLLVYFGYPQAHEDDAIRAVNAALRIQEEMPALQSRLGARVPTLRDSPLGLRVTIHTGPVVVGDIGEGTRRQPLAVGHTLNLAARLQAVAAPGSIAISEATLRLVRGVFVVGELGEHLLKGLVEPVRVFRIAGRRRARSRLELAEEDGLTPFVGRERELAELVHCWEDARDGGGRVALIEGEPGIGKSRLVRRLREELGRSPAWLECRGSAYRTNSAFHPVIELVERGLDFSMDLPEAEKLARLAAELDRLKLEVDAVLPLFASLLSLSLPGDPGLGHLNAETRRRRTLEAMAAWLFRQAERQPVVMVAEDLHWFDPSTLELLDLVIARMRAARVTLLLTYRPSFEPPWRGQPHASRVVLGSLAHEHVVAMVRELGGARVVPPPVLEELVRKSDGVPLFVEELTRDLLESAAFAEVDADAQGAGPLPALAVPETLKDSLMARLDRLGPAKEVVQVASVLGREFSFDLLHAVLSMDGSTLASALARLVVAGLLRQEGSPPEAIYVFKHALIRDTAYHSLLRRTRQHCHAQVAHALESRFPVLASAQPEVMALHFEEATLFEQAIAYYERASEHATQRSAHLEAIRQLTKAIELLRFLPEGEERNRREARLQVALGVPLQASKGYADSEVERAYRRGRDLAEAFDDALLFRALWGLSQHYNSRAELKVAGELNEQLLALAERRGEPSLRLLAHAESGVGFFWRGEPNRALEHAEQTVALYDPALHGSLGYRHGHDPAIAARAYGSAALAISGRPRSAVRWADACLELARRAENPFDRAIALAFIAIAHQALGERERVRRLADECLALSTEHGFPLYVGMSRALRAWSIANMEEGAGAPADLRLGLTEAIRTGNQAGAPYGMGLLAEAYLDAGEDEKALGVVQRAMVVARQSATHVWDAELHRLQGEALLRRRDPKEAERCFRTALAIARKRGMRTFELRNAARLARLSLEQGNPDEARDLLAPVLADLDEGGESPDWLGARAMLETLPPGTDSRPTSLRTAWRKEETT